MIIRDCTLLLEIISKIENYISDEINQHPHLSDEEILERIKYKFQKQNKD